MKPATRSLATPLLFTLTACFCAFLPPSPAPASAPEAADASRSGARPLYDQAMALVKASLDPEHLTRALELLHRASRLDPGNEAVWVQIAWRSWLLGEDTSREDKEGRNRRTQLFEQGLAAGKKALALDRNSVGGIYWYTVNLAALGEMEGVLSSLKLTGTLLVNKGRVDRLDPDYLYGATRRLLSEIFVRVPPWLARKFGFTPQLLEQDLQDCIARWPNFFANYTFLARVYVWADEKGKALDQLAFVLKTPADSMPGETSENAREQEIARRMWKAYTGKEYPAR